MKYTRSIQLAASAAVFINLMAWGENSPAPTGGDSTGPVLAAVGEGSGTASAAAQPTADRVITSSPVGIAHSQQTVSDFRDGTKAGSSGSADQILMLANKTIDVIVTFGGGYDSNPYWQPEGKENAEFVTWADLRFLLNPDMFSNNGRGWYFGADLDTSIFSYESNDRSPTGGRDQGEAEAKGFIGIRGAKTDVRFDADYRFNNGSMLDFLDLDRETGRADSDDVNLRLSAVHRLDHSQLNGYLLWGQRDFNSDSALNDITQTAADVGWLFSPAFAPKTDVGAGFHIGSFSTDRNFTQDFYEPSLRFNYRFSPKTSMWGRVGYTFIDYDATGSLGDSSFMSYAAGIRWAPSAKTAFDLSASRDFRPALAYANQNYYWDEVQFSISQLLPSNWSLRSYVAYDSADYFSTLANGAANRQDEYWRVGADLSHPLTIFDRLNGQISAFYYYNTNDSTVSVAEFDQVFTGMKVGISY